MVGTSNQSVPEMAIELRHVCLRHVPMSPGNEKKQIVINTGPRAPLFFLPHHCFQPKGARESSHKPFWELNENPKHIIFPVACGLDMGY